LLALKNKYNLPFTNEVGLRVAYPHKVKTVVRKKKIQENVSIAHHVSDDFVEWSNQNIEAARITKHDVFRKKNHTSGAK
jgi:hypothetical protein